MAKNTWMGDQSSGSAAASASQIGMVGTDRRSSMRRWITCRAARRNNRRCRRGGRPGRRQRHGDEPDRHRRLSAVHEPGPLVAAKAIGTEQVDALGRADIGRSQKMGGWPGTGRAPGTDTLGRRIARRSSGRGRLATACAASSGFAYRRRRARVVSTEPLEEARALDRNERQAGIGGLGILGAEEVRNEDDRVETQEDSGAHHRQAVLPEAPPHECPVRGERDAVLGRRRAGA